MTALTCPKCADQMRAYERNGVTVDQCAGCRGVFLDRGELERLIDAEAGFYAGGREPERQPERRPEPPRYDERKYDTDTHDHGGYKKRKRTSFLAELFD